MMRRNVLSTTLLILLALTLAVTSSRCLDQGVGITPTGNGLATPLADRVLYVMHDHANTDWLAEYPHWPSMPGAWMYWGWDELQPSRYTYEWQKIDDYLDRAYNLGKPVALSIMLYGHPGRDSTPRWVYTEHGIDPWVTDTGHVYPSYNSGAWDREFESFVTAFGARYDGDPRVASVWIATGLYGETVITHPDGSKLGHNPARFFANAITWYDAAFDETPLYAILTGPTDRAQLTAMCAERGIGIKQNALHPDLPNHWSGPIGRENGRVGLLEAITPYSRTVPIAFEHFYKPDEGYWAVATALSYGADVIDLPVQHLDWLATHYILGRTVWEWVEDMGQSSEYGLWMARDTKFYDGDWDRGKPGPFEYRIEHVYGNLDLRRRDGDGITQFGFGIATDGVLGFETDVSIPYAYTIIARDEGGPWYHIHGERSTSYFDVQCDEIHRVEVWPISDDATPTPRPSSTETRQPTMTVTPVAGYTPTIVWPTLTVTPTADDALAQEVATLWAEVATLAAKMDAINRVTE